MLNFIEILIQQADRTSFPPGDHIQGILNVESAGKEVPSVYLVAVNMQENPGLHERCKGTQGNEHSPPRITALFGSKTNVDFLSHDFLPWNVLKICFLALSTSSFVSFCLPNGNVECDSKTYIQFLIVMSFGFLEGSQQRPSLYFCPSFFLVPEWLLPHTKQALDCIEDFTNLTWVWSVSYTCFPME